MKLERIQKKKIHWTTIYVYATLCYDYFSNRKHTESTIIKLEKILFLMQCESLVKYNIPLLVYKTYIHDNKIYLRYLSDLLRVNKPHTASDNRYLIFMKVEKYKYEQMMNKYNKMSNDELDTKILELVRNDLLPCEYFSYEEYTRNDMRVCARMQMDYKGKLIVILGLLSFPGIVCTILLPLKIIGIHILPYSVSELALTILFTIPFLLVLIILLYKITTTPTKYELENDFLKK